MPQRIADLCHQTSPSDVVGPLTDEQHSGCKYVPYKMDATQIQSIALPCGNAIREDGQVTSRLGRIIRPQLSGTGYWRVELWANGRGRKFLLHRLLAEAFIPNPEGKPQVNHIDGNKPNNSLSNLEWVTQSENQIHAYRSGLQRGYKKPTPLSDAHKKALCGSRWRGQRREYWAGGLSFAKPEDAAAHFGVNRQTFYNRAASPRFPDWEIKTWREVK